MSERKNKLSVIIPVFNEGECIVEVANRLLELREKLLSELDLELLFVDDGSSDMSLSILKEISAKNLNVKIIVFSRNFGHQIAVTAGIDMACGDYVAIIDADLQDPPELLEDMYHLALQGFDVVYGKRRSRAGETLLKRLTAVVFYKFINYMCDINIPMDTGDFRLMSRRVVDELKQLRERHRFIRGLIPWLGFKSVPFEYDRHVRFAGKTKYPFSKMIRFAMNAILSFSQKPLILAMHLGFWSILVGIFGGLYMLYIKLFTTISVPGITVVIFCIILFGGIQIFLIGIIGEYIARIFEESKQRPLYIVAETTNI